MITQLQIKFAPDSKPESSTAGKTTFADALAAASKAAVILTERSAEVIEHANTFCTSMVARGGGVKGIEVHIRMPRKYLPSPANARQFFAGVVPNASEAKTSTSSSPDADADADVDVDGMPFLTLHLLVDVCDAMGANLVNTIAEGASPFITSLTGGTVGLRILSNLCVHRTVAASFRLPLDALAWKGVAGKEVAEKVVAAFQFARDDSFRACTHNKGAMNGIDAVALATGQDTRAVEASIHAYAATGGLYQPITRYANYSPLLFDVVCCFLMFYLFFFVLPLSLPPPPSLPFHPPLPRATSATASTSPPLRSQCSRGALRFPSL